MTSHDGRTAKRPIERSAKFEKFIDQQLARYEKDKLEGEGIELADLFSRRPVILAGSSTSRPGCSRT
jgi:hypothetical protein